MTPEQLQDFVSKKYPGLDVEPLAADLTVFIPAEKYLEFCKFLKNDPELQFENLMCLTAVDQPENLELVSHLNSYSKNHRIGVKVKLPKENPKIASVVSLWPGANWHEREAFDLYGIQFDGHPDLRRILLPDDWEGSPMRKDYKHWNLTPLPDDMTEVTKDYPVIPSPMR